MPRCTPRPSTDTMAGPLAWQMWCVVSLCVESIVPTRERVGNQAAGSNTHKAEGSIHGQGSGQGDPPVPCCVTETKSYKSVDSFAFFGFLARRTVCGVSELFSTQFPRVLRSASEICTLRDGAPAPWQADTNAYQQRFWCHDRPRSEKNGGFGYARGIFHEETMSVYL